MEIEWTMDVDDGWPGDTQKSENKQEPSPNQLILHRRSHLRQKSSTPSTHESLHARSHQGPHPSGPSHPPCLPRRLLALYRDATTTAAALGVCVILIDAVLTPLKCTEVVLLRYDPVN